MDLSTFKLSGLLITTACLIAGSALAQSTAQPTPQSDPAITTDKLEGINRRLEQSEQRELQISKELTALEKEARQISQRLITLATKTHKGEEQITNSEKKIALLDQNQKLLIARLAIRRDELGELLVGLQRLERDPPPPIVVHPRDALAAIRSATLFGAIIPAIKAETTAIRRDLSELKNVRISLSTAQKDLKIESLALDNVHAELKALLDRKKGFVRKTQTQLEYEQKRTANLVAKAKNLNQLLAKIKEDKLQAEKLKTETARKKEAIRQARLLKPKLVFSKTLGQLPFPASGKLLRKFNQKNQLGQVSKGVLLRTRKQAQVTAPANAVVEFAGKFRSYGQLLILNVGEGYHMLLGGLGKIEVETGQHVNAGEPIGFMGKIATRGTLITSALDVRQPVLYIELRKNGGPVDPSNWWLPKHKKVQY